MYTQTEVYRLSPDGSLSLLDADGRTGVTGEGTSPIDMLLSNHSKYLYVLNSGDNSIAGFRVERAADSFVKICPAFRFFDTIIQRFFSENPVRPVGSAGPEMGEAPGIRLSGGKGAGGYCFFCNYPIKNPQQLRLENQWPAYGVYLVRNSRTNGRP